jgi:hypothetical protein
MVEGNGLNDWFNLSKRLAAMEKSRAKQMQWTAAEDKIITDGREANPPVRYKILAVQLPGRSKDAIQARWERIRWDGAGVRRPGRYLRRVMLESYHHLDLGLGGNRGHCCRNADLSSAPRCEVTLGAE